MRIRTEFEERKKRYETRYRGTFKNVYYLRTKIVSEIRIRNICQKIKNISAAVRARHIVAALVSVGFALCGAVEVSSSVALLANQEDNHAIIDTSWHCDMLVNISRRNRTEDFEVILLEVQSTVPKKCQHF